MLGRNYPIMFGLGTKIVTSYHYPSFKTGLMIAICDSKKKLEKRPLTDKEFKEAYNGIIKELYFDKPETLKRFIDQLTTSYEDWLLEIEKENKIRNLLTSMKKAGIIDTDSDNQQKSNWILK